MALASVSISFSFSTLLLTSAPSQTSEYKLRGDLRGSKGPVSAATFTNDSSMVLIGGDDGHVRVYSTKDLSSLQTLYDKTWGKVTALTCLTINAAGNRGESICVGTIRGSICLIPRANSTSWFSQRYSKVYNILEFNNSVAAQACDDANQRLVVASHNGTIKLFSVSAGVDMTELWVIPPVADAIPADLKFFGAGSQNILLTKIENGEILCIDAQTSNQLWQKHLTSAIGHAALSPGEDLLFTHNLTQGHFQLHRFPGTPAEAIPGVTSTQHRIIQGVFAEEGKIIVCGSDHGTVYVVDTATREILQKLSGSGLMQVIAVAKHEDGYDMIVGGSSLGGFEAYMWVKEPFESANEPLATGFTVVYAKWFSIAKQAAYCVLYAAVLLPVLFPTMAVPFVNVSHPWCQMLTAQLFKSNAQDLATHHHAAPDAFAQPVEHTVLSPVISVDSNIAEQSASPVTLSYVTQAVGAQSYTTIWTITSAQAKEVSTITQFVTVTRPTAESFTTTKPELSEEESAEVDDVEVPFHVVGLNI
ncbi:hypothetical protein J132_07403 [Termitomyces sp. J132]|nr:hypothetical protein J132_07403 [Termitomyces sp. J132]